MSRFVASQPCPIPWSAHHSPSVRTRRDCRLRGWLTRAGTPGVQPGHPPRSTNVHAANLARYNLAGACREGYSLANGGRALRMSPARTASQRTLSCGPARRMDRRRDVDLPPEGHLSSARGERWPTARVISPADPHGRVCWDGHSQEASGRGVSLPVVENPTPRQPPRPPRPQGGSTCVTAASSATGRGARPPMASLRGRHPSTIQLANGVLWPASTPPPGTSGAGGGRQVESRTPTRPRRRPAPAR